MGGLTELRVADSPNFLTGYSIKTAAIAVLGQPCEAPIAQNIGGELRKFRQPPGANRIIGCAV